MTNDNKFKPTFKPEPNVPKTETRIILNDWQQPVKQSNLSAAARSKVINKNKPYQSQNQENYGPCSYSGCSNSKPFRFHLEVPAKNWFSGSHRFIFVNNGNEYTSFTLYTVEQARERLRDFEGGIWKVMLEGALYTGEGGNLTSQKNRLTREWLRNAIRDHENGYEICVDRQFSRYSE